MDIRDFGFIGAALLGALLFVAGLFAVANLMSRLGCEATAAQMGVEHRYSVWTDCMVRVDERWIPLDAYKVVKVRP